MFVVVRDADDAPLEVRASTRLRAPYAALVDVLGPIPDGQPGWTLARHGEVLARIREASDDESDPGALEDYSTRPWYEWRVEADEDRSMRRVCGWLSRRVIAWAQAQPRVRVLRDDARPGLDRLIAEGVPLDRALELAGAWVEPDLPALFAWPLQAGPAQGSQGRA
jgi:hypothetical protein